MSVSDDFFAQCGRNKVVPGADVFEAVEGLTEHARLAAAAEGAGQRHAYAEWLQVASMAYMRAVRLGKADRTLIGEWGKS